MRGEDVSEEDVSEGEDVSEEGDVSEGGGCE